MGKKVNNSSTDIQVLFGVEGGSSITTGSGQIIAETLAEMLTKIEKNVTNHLVISADTKALETLGKQVIDTITNAVKTIKTLPIEFTLTPSKQSVDAVIDSLKETLAKQNIGFSLNPKNNPKSSINSGSSSTSKEAQNTKKEVKDISDQSQKVSDNIKKSAETIKDTVSEIDSVITKLLSKIDKGQDSATNSVTTRLKKIKDTYKSVFSSNEAALFDKAVSLTSNKDTLTSIGNYILHVGKERSGGNDINTQKVLNNIKSLVSRDVTYKKVPYEKDELEVLKAFLNSRKNTKATESGYRVTAKTIQKWFGAKDTIEEISKVDAELAEVIKKYKERGNGFIQALSNKYTELFDFNLDKIEGYTLKTKDYSDIDKAINDNQKAISDRNKKSRLAAIGSVNKELDDIVAGNHKVVESTKEVETEFNNLKDTAKSALNSTEKGVKDIINSEKDLAATTNAVKTQYNLYDAIYDLFASKGKNGLKNGKEIGVKSFNNWVERFTGDAQDKYLNGIPFSKETAFAKLVSDSDNFKSNDEYFKYLSQQLYGIIETGTDAKGHLTLILKDVDKLKSKLSSVGQETKSSLDLLENNLKDIVIVTKDVNNSTINPNSLLFGNISFDVTSISIKPAMQMLQMAIQKRIEAALTELMRNISVVPAALPYLSTGSVFPSAPAALPYNLDVTNRQIQRDYYGQFREYLNPANKIPEIIDIDPKDIKVVETAIDNQTEALGEEIQVVKETVVAHEKLIDVFDEEVNARDRLNKTITTVDGKQKSSTISTQDSLTGKTYRTTQSKKKDKNGTIVTSVSETESTKQAESFLNKTRLNITKIQQDLDKLINTDTSKLTGSLQEGLKLSINRVIDLEKALRELVINGDYTALYNLNVDSYKAGEAEIVSLISLINNKIKEGNKEVSDNSRNWNNISTSLLKVKDTIQDIERETKSLQKSDTLSVTSKLRKEIEGDIKQANKLADILIKISQSDTPEESQKYTNILQKKFKVDDFSSGEKALQYMLSDIESKLNNASKLVSENSRQWSKSLDTVNKYKDTIDQISREEDKLTISDSRGLTKTIRSDIDDAKNDALSLITLLEKISTSKNSGVLAKYTKQLRETYGVDSFEEGVKLLQIQIEYLNDKLKEGFNLAGKYTDYFSKIKSIGLDKLKLSNTISGYKNVGVDVKGIENDTASEFQLVDKLIKKIEQFHEYTSKGLLNYNWSEEGVEGVNSLDSAMEKLIETVSLLTNKVRTFEESTSKISDDEAVTLGQKLINSYNSFLQTPGHEKYTKLNSSAIADDVAKALANNDFDTLKNKIKQITDATRDFADAERELRKQNKDSQSIITQRNKLYQDAYSYYQKYQSGIRANITLNNQWLSVLKQVKRGELDNESAKARISELQVATKNANAETMTLWGSLKKLFTDHFGAISATYAIGTLRNVLRNMYQDILDIDKAMTELKKVTELTEGQYESFLNTAAEIGTKVGGTIADTINATADFARLGFNIDDASSLAEAALVYKNVGDGLADINEASESIISTIKAFSDIDAKDAMSIIDKFNEVGNNYAISSAGIGIALQKSAAALASANNTLDESIALITAGNSVVQNPEIIGTTMKTVSMYLRASKTEAEEAGLETEGMAESVSKLRSEILKLSKVDIMLDSKNYKSTYQILKELSEVWENISDVSQANILEKLGGKRNANVVASIIENFDVAEQALQTSMDSIGSASVENEKYLESIEGHVNKLKISVEELSETILNSDVIKTVVDGLKIASDSLKGIINLAQGVGPIIAGILGNELFNKGQFGFGKVIEDGTVKLGLFGKSFKQLKQDISEQGAKAIPSALSDRLASIFGLTRKKDIENNITLVKEYKDGLTSILKSDSADKAARITELFNKRTTGDGAFVNSSADVKAFVGELKDISVNSEDASSAVSTLDAKVQAFTESQRESAKQLSFGSLAINTLKNAAISLGVSLVTGFAMWGISQLIDNIINGEQKLIDKVKEATDAYNTQNDTLEDLQKEYNEIISSSETETEKTKELYEWKKQLIEAYGDEEEAIRKVNLARESGEDFFEKEKFKEAQKYLSNPDNIKVYSDITNKLSGYTIYDRSLTVGTNTNEEEKLEQRLNNQVDIIKKYSNKIKTELSSHELLGGSADSGYQKQTAYQLKFIFGDDYKQALNNLDEIIELMDAARVSEAGLSDEEIGVYNQLIAERKKIEDYLKENDSIIRTTNEARYTEALYLFLKQSNKRFEDINQNNFEWFKTEFENYIKSSGELSDYFNDVDFTQVFQSKISDIEVTLFPEKLLSESDIIVTSLKDKLTSLDDSIKLLLSNKDTIESVLKKVRQGLVLTEDEVLKLKEISPDLLGKFKELDGGWTISESDLSSVYEKQLDNLSDKIEESRSKIQKQINSILSESSSKFVDNADSLPSSIVETLASDEKTKRIEELRSQYSALGTVLSILALDINNVNEKLREYNNTIEYSAKLGNNLSTLKSATALSGSAGVYSKFGDWARDFDKQARAMQSAYTENKELTDAYNRWYRNRNTETAKALVDVYKKAYSEDLSNYNKYLIQKATGLGDYVNDDSIWKQFISDNETAVEELSKLYGIDLVNVATYAEARKKILDNAIGKQYSNFSSLPTDAQAGILKANSLDLDTLQATFLSWFTVDPLSSDDSTELGLNDQSYSKSLDEIQQANDGTLEAEKVFIKKWVELNDKFYATTDPEKYKTNLREIASYISGLSKTVQEHLTQWAREYEHNDNRYADRLVYLQEWENSSKELYGTLSLIEKKIKSIENVGGDATASLKSLAEVKKAIDEDALSRAKYEADTYKLKYESGYYKNFDEYKSDILELGNTYKSSEGKNLLDGTFFDEYVDANAEFTGFLKETKKTNEKTIEAERDYLNSVRKKLKELRTRKDNPMDPNDYLENYMKEYADPYVKWINNQIDKGLMSPEKARKKIQKFFDRAFSADNVDLGKDWLADALNIDGYEYESKQLMKANDKTLKAEQDYVAKMKELNHNQYGDPNSNFYDLTKYENNLKSITDYELAMLKKAFEEGKLTAKEYAEYVANSLKDKDILGADYVAEQAKDALDARGNREKTYWEQQKELATQYYDAEIKKLQEVKDEEEKVNKAEELRLNLIKARQKLEEAKSQKNQLIFHDGTFEYVADQEAIMSAEEEVANALKEIKDNELQEQIDLLTEQKDEALLFYSNIIGMLDYYINGTRQIESSDPEVIEKAMASESGKYFMRLMLGEITPDEVRDELRKQFTKDETATITADSTVTDSHDKADTRSDSTINEIAKVGGEVAGIVNSFTGFVDNMKSLDIGGLFNLVTSLMGKVSKDDTIGFVGASTSEAISNAINNVYNNSNVSNDNSVNVGDIHMTIQGGTSQEMLDQFANQLSSAIITAAPRVLTSS